MSIWNIDYSKGISSSYKKKYPIVPTNRTALVQVSNLNSVSSNDSFFYYRLRSCDTNLTTNTPASQYQRQKIIQRTVRVDSSQYTMNLASLAGYQRPNKRNGYVPWNQMSDRAEPSKQKANPNGGNTIGGNSTRRSITRLRPGAMSPGGVGCDIKHNSYERYLNRLKGKAPLRRGVIPPNFGIEEIPFNRAFPIYGDKVMKTSIVSGCDCPISDNKNDYKIFNSTQTYDFNIPYKYSVGQNILVVVDGVQELVTIIADLGNGNFIIQFENGEMIEANQSEFIIYDSACNYDVRDYNSPNFIHPGGSFVDQFSGPNDVVACQKLNGSISNIRNEMTFFPELNNSYPTNGIFPNVELFKDDGIRYTNGIPSQSYL
jgi:hypothetical protein